MEFNGTETQMRLYNNLGIGLMGFDAEDIIIVLNVLLHEMKVEGNTVCR